MHLGHKNTAPFDLKLTLLLRNSWRFALLGILFALTCWEVNPGQMPTPGDLPSRFESSTVVTEVKADRVR